MAILREPETSMRKTLKEAHVRIYGSPPNVGLPSTMFVAGFEGGWKFGREQMRGELEAEIGRLREVLQSLNGDIAAFLKQLNEQARKERGE